jgi:hypothetical protein
MNIHGRALLTERVSLVNFMLPFLSETLSSKLNIPVYQGIAKIQNNITWFFSESNNVRLSLQLN